ncbi:hypothetical protein ACS0TY_005460 [Phlomoides rotata]
MLWLFVFENREEQFRDLLSIQSGNNSKLWILLGMQLDKMVIGEKRPEGVGHGIKLRKTHSFNV